MPTSTLDKKISVNSFFQNSDEISDELNRVNEKSEQALQKSDSAIARTFSNENYLQSLIQSISTQNESIANVVSENKSQSSIINNTNTEIISIKRDDDSQVREITKAFGILRGLYDSLASAMLSVRSDVETISKYLFDEQKQRKQQLEQRELKISQQKDVQEKQSIVDSFRKSMGIGVKSDEGISKDSQMKSGDEANFMQSLMQGALASAGMSLGTALTNGTDGGTPGSAPDGADASPSSGSSSNKAVYGTKAQKALLDAIAFAEGNTSWSTWADYQKHGPEDLTGLTIRQVHDLQTSFIKSGKVRRTGSAVVGRYQFKDLLYHAKVAGLNPETDKFSPANQDRIAIKLSERRGVTADMLAKEGLSAKVSNMLAPEWASFPTYSGASYYGQPVKNLKSLQNVYKQSLGTTSQQSQTAQTKPPGAAQTSQASKSDAATPAASAAAPAQTSQAMPADTQSDVTGGLKSKDGNLLKGATSKDMQEKIKQSSAQPLSSPTSASSIMPFDYQSARQSSETIPQPTQTSSNLSTAPDLPPEIPTNNPLTRMWTMSAINHLNINASMHHIYG
jgi:muramidase (phage lysozyme)